MTKKKRRAGPPCPINYRIPRSRLTEWFVAPPRQLARLTLYWGLCAPQTNTNVGEACVMGWRTCSGEEAPPIAAPTTRVCRVAAAPPLAAAATHAASTTHAASAAFALPATHVHNTWRRRLLLTPLLLPLLLCLASRPARLESIFVFVEAVTFCRLLATGRATESCWRCVLIASLRLGGDGSVRLLLAATFLVTIPPPPS